MQRELCVAGVGPSVSQPGSLAYAGPVWSFTWGDSGGLKCSRVSVMSVRPPTCLGAWNRRLLSTSRGSAQVCAFICHLIASSLLAAELLPMGVFLVP